MRTPWIPASAEMTKVGAVPLKRKKPVRVTTGRAGSRAGWRAYLISMVRAVETGFFLPSVSVSTPFSSFALVVSTSISSGSS